MTAWQLPQLGSIDNLSLNRDLPDPSPSADQVVIELELAALNPADRYLAEGMYPARPTLPHILGRDGVGTVVAVGANVSDTKIGDVRAIMRGETGVTAPGTFATRVAVNADSIVSVPDGWSLEQIAGASLVYLTAYQAITQWPDLPAGCATLVTGASGGVGVAMTQLAKAMGHTVVGLSRSAEKSATLKSIGADFIFDPTTPWPKYLKADVGRRINLAVDNVGGEGFNDVIGAMEMHGRISVVGQLAGPVPSFSPATLFFRRLRVGGVAAGSYTRDAAQSAWREIVQLLGERRPLVDQVFAFDQLPQAFARLQAGPMGKVLLRLK